VENVEKKVKISVHDLIYLKVQQEIKF